MNLKSLLKTSSLLAASSLLLPFAAYSTEVEANGSCPAGLPCSTTALTLGGSVGPTTFSFVYTFGDGDKYQVSGQYFAGFPSGTNSFFTPTATVTSLGTTVATDVLTLDLIQAYTTGSSTTNWSGTYSEHYPLSLSSGAAAGSFVEGQTFYSTTGAPEGLGLVGPFGPGTTNNISESKDLTLAAGATLTSDIDLVYSFAKGTAAGTTASSTPEPTQTMSLGLGILACGYALIRRRNRAKATA